MSVKLLNYRTMQITKETLTPTTYKLTVVADQKALDALKSAVLKRLSIGLKLPGFRAGKAPVNMVEKQIDQQLLQNEFLNDAVNELYAQALREKELRVVKEPDVQITAFVPFTTLEFSAEVEAVGDMTIADYTKIKMSPEKVIIASTDVDEVVDNLLERSAEKKDVKRALKDGDEATISFIGKDAKTKKAIDGADGSDYPLVIGSNSFIPGFEEELVGLKKGDKKTFDITFPEDYHADHLKKKKVTFDVEIIGVKELVKPKLDDKFAASAGPFTTVDELKADIKKQLVAEKDKQAQEQFDNDLLKAIADKSQVAVPESLVEQEVERLEEEERRNIAYQGLTWQEHLDQEGVTEEEHRDRQKPIAELRIKTGLILGEISEKEKIRITPDELSARLTILKDQYNDESMRAELDKPENQKDIQSRILIEKTIDRLRSIATAEPAASKKK
jgi:trigger factor